MSLAEEKSKAFPLLSNHLSSRYKKLLEWVRVSITILTPSLVLLIGLQEKPPRDEMLLNVLLLTSILLLTVSILIGLWVLLGESEAHGQAAADIKEWVESGKKIDDLKGGIKFPSYQNIMLRFFPAIVWLAVLSLGAFGCAKIFLTFHSRRTASPPLNLTLGLSMNESQFREIWVDGPYGQMICALISGEAGWLMYLRESGDAGFSSRNPAYAGAAEAVISYVLSDGQEDEYPAAWAYPVDTVEKAIEYFRTHGIPPPFITWYNDSGDGLPPGPRPNPSFQRTAAGGR